MLLLNIFVTLSLFSNWSEVPNWSSFGSCLACHLWANAQTHTYQFCRWRKFECTHTRQGYDARTDVTASVRPFLIKCMVPNRSFLFCIHLAAVIYAARPLSALIKRKVRFQIVTRRRNLNFHQITKGGASCWLGRKRQLSMLLFCRPNKITRNSLCSAGVRSAPTGVANIFYTYGRWTKILLSTPAALIN